MEQLGRGGEEEKGFENVLEMTEDRVTGKWCHRKTQEVGRKGVAILLRRADAKTTEQSFLTSDERVGCSNPLQSHYPASTLES